VHAPIAQQCFDFVQRLNRFLGRDIERGRRARLCDDEAIGFCSLATINGR
jgi:hypothetical protein